MLRDGLSDGIGVGSHLIKECVWQLKADSPVKGLHLIMGKIGRSQRNTLRISTLERRRLLRNSLHSARTFFKLLTLLL